MKKYICTAADRNKIIKAKEILDDEFNKPSSPYRLARKVDKCPNKLSAVFKETQLYTPYEFQLELRVEEAIKLLLKTKLRIYEIAFTCGYAISGPFSKIYKLHTGTAPNKWRKLQLSAPRHLPAN
jgi:transcriptional regulator GlxA family with amidase domain